METSEIRPPSRQVRRHLGRDDERHRTWEVADSACVEPVGYSASLAAWEMTFDPACRSTGLRTIPGASDALQPF